MYDITIVGGGPAGATLARLLGNHYKVLLLDRRDLNPNPRQEAFEKCCGGLLAPDAQNMLARFGLGVPREVLVGPQLFTVRTIDMDNGLERYYQRHYINVDREAFDRWLVSLVPPSVDARFGALFRHFEEQKDSIKVVYTQSQTQYCEYTKILVGADGAFSKVRRLAFSEEDAPRKYISIQKWYEVEETPPYFSSIFDSQITDFYSWTIPKERFLLVGTALDIKDNPWNKFRLLEHKLLETGYEWGACVKQGGAFILRPQSLHQITPGRGQIALIGEAAGWISPSSAEGFSYAFRSALALAESLLEDADFLKGYIKRVQGLRQNILLKNLKSPFMYHPFIRKAVMKTGIMSMNVHS